MIGKLEKVLNSPKLYLIYILGRFMRGSIAADRVYLEVLFKYKIGKSLNLKHPKTYNEKIQWLKLYDRKPEYTLMTDKYEVKKYVSELIGEEHIIPTLGVWTHFDDIDFDSLPNQFVLKCTHDSGGLAIVKDKLKLDKKAIKKKIEHCLKRNYFLNTREWSYKNIKPRIIAEPFLEDSAVHELRDYKFFCFNGTPHFIFIVTNRAIGKTTIDYFDMDFNHLNIVQHYPNATIHIPKPKTWNKMIELARKLSKDKLHVRVDFYEVDSNTYFGELTFYHFSGFTPFEPDEWDGIVGSWLVLSIEMDDKDGE
jgi:hypothetical protein